MHFQIPLLFFLAFVVVARLLYWRRLCWRPVEERYYWESPPLRLHHVAAVVSPSWLAGYNLLVLRRGRSRLRIKKDYFKLFLIQTNILRSYLHILLAAPPSRVEKGRDQRPPPSSSSSSSISPSVSPLPAAPPPDGGGGAPAASGHSARGGGGEAGGRKQSEKRKNTHSCFKFQMFFLFEMLCSPWCPELLQDLCHPAVVCRRPTDQSDVVVAVVV